MYLNHQIVNTNSINVCSVKTDTFTLGANNFELAKPLLKFNNNMGSRRVSQTEDIDYPRHKLMLKQLYIKLNIANYEVTKFRY